MRKRNSGTVEVVRGAGGGVVGYRARLPGNGARLATLSTREEAEKLLDSAPRGATTVRRSERSESFVYFIQDGSNGPIKIGRSKNPAQRLYYMQTNAARREMRLLAVMPGGSKMEMALHRSFRTARMKGEWFVPTPELLALVDEVRTHWSAAQQPEGTVLLVARPEPRRP